MARILQLNLGRAKEAHDLAFEEAMRKKVDLLIISEPNKKISKSRGWITDSRGDISVVVVNKGLEIDEIDRKEGYVHVRLFGIHIYATYISPNIAMIDFKQKIDEIFEEASSHPTKSIVAGDVNAKSSLWGSPFADARGEHIEDWMSQLAWSAKNTGTHTFERGKSKTYIDVTLSSVQMAKNIKNWQVEHINPFTHHGHISYEIKTDIRIQRHEPRKTYLNAGKYVQLLREIDEKTGDDVYVSMVSAFRESTTEVRGGSSQRPYWWSEELEKARIEHVRLRRQYTRCKGPEEERILLLQRAKEQARLMKKMIRTSKRNSWKNVLSDLENDIWGEGYRIVCGHCMRGKIPYKIPAAKRRRILSDLFPDSKIRPKRARSGITVPEPFTMKELEIGMRGIKNGKAPGPDGLSVEALKIVHKIIPDKLLTKLNELLRKQEFPDSWRTARVVLLPKEGKDPDLSTSYRPICLLNTMNKLYERLIVNRLEVELEEKSLMSQSQHGFRKGKSTVSAILEVKDGIEKVESKWCVAISLDIKNAFNTARWEHIMDSLTEGNVSEYLLRCVDSYFGRRSVKCGSVKHRCAMGVPQGSVMGPVLWNVMYDGVLREPYDEKVTAVAYADDLLFLVEGKDENEVKSRAERTMSLAVMWMKKKGLEIAPQKTVMAIMRAPRNKKTIEITVEGTRVEASPSLKYLGVILGRNMKFSAHVRYMVEKAEAKCAQLQRIMPNIGGPAYAKRRLLCGIIHSIVLYASPVWREVTEIETHSRKLISVQRKGLLRAISAYRTVSAEAAQVIAGFPPVDLMVKERCFLYKVGGRTEGMRRMARRRTNSRWQQRWESNTERATWTKRLIANIEQWTECKHKRTCYFFTQFLTGHGSYWSFTCRIGKSTTDLCMGCNKRDSPEHMFVECARWDSERSEMVENLGFMPTIEEMIPRMLEDEEVWKEIYNYVVRVMTRKELEDRMTQRAEGTNQE